MRRNPDTVRDLLLRIEKGETDMTAQCNDEVSTHLHQMYDAGLIAGGSKLPVPVFGGDEIWNGMRLTWAGADFPRCVRFHFDQHPALIQGSGNLGN